MSNNDELKQEQAFAKWLDGKSEDCQEANHTLWQDRKSTAQAIAHEVKLSCQENVPLWDRASTFKGDKAPIWQWRGLPAVSMAFSIFAVALVLFKVELIIQENGVLLSFANNNKQLQAQKVEQLIDQKLQTFAQEQQVILANYVADIKVKQQDNNLQLASYILGASRQARKEDINDFIQYINAQRKDELLDQKIKYQQLEQAIKYNKAYKTENVKGFGLKQDDVKNAPTNWTAEE